MIRIKRIFLFFIRRYYKFSKK